MKTVRLTTAQAIVRYLVAQRTVIDGVEVPLFPGVFAIFGHGNVTGLGFALDEAARRAADDGAARTSRAWRSPRSATRRRCGAGRSWWRPSSIGPGATNMVTAAGVAMANRLPLLLLSGDTFQSRSPTRCCSRSSTSATPSTTVNDAFRAVTRYWDRITAPGAGGPVAAARRDDDARSGRLRAGLPRSSPGRPGRGVRLPRAAFRADACTSSRRQRPDAASWPRAARALRGAGAHWSSPAAASTTRSPSRAPRVRRGARPARGRDRGGQVVPDRRPPVLTPARSASPAAISANRLAAEADVVLAVGTRLQDFTTGSWTVFGERRPDADRAQRRAVRRDEAPARMPLVGDAREGLVELGASARRLAAPTRRGSRVPGPSADGYKAFVAGARPQPTTARRPTHR